MPRPLAFWQSLPEALEDEGIDPRAADADPFFRDLAVFRGWRRGGPGNDADYAENTRRLQNAFIARWTQRHPEQG